MIGSIALPWRHLLATLTVVALASGASVVAGEKAKKKTGSTPVAYKPIPAPTWPDAKRQDFSVIAAAIDRHVEARLTKEKIPASPLADDAEFLRRISLDLTGRIPTAQRAAAFLDSRDPDRRAKLIDEFLTSKDYGQHFGNVWYDLLVPRTPIANRINAQAMKNAFVECFDKNLAWHETVARMIRCQDRETDKNFFAFYEINGDMGGTPMANVVARTFTRRFMGLRMECAECHDDPYKPWKQREYWGITAYFGRVARSKVKDMPVIEETTGYKPPKGNNFRLTVTNDGSLVVHEEARHEVGKAMKPRVLDGEDQSFADKQPMLADFIHWVTAPNNKYLAPAAVNRYWHHLFARGLVDPVDDFHADNPTTHPEILSLLGEEFIRSRMDVKHLLRCICNSKTYQRSSRPIPGNDKVDNPLFSRMAVKVLTAEMLHDSLCLAHDNPRLFPTEQPKNKKLPTVMIRSQFLQMFRTNDPDGDATDYTAGIPQMLILLNSPVFNANSPRVGELVKGKLAPEQAIGQLYLATLSRHPTPAELQRKLDLVRRHATIREGLDGVLWSLTGQAEFVLNR